MACDMLMHAAKLLLMGGKKEKLLKKQLISLLLNSKWSALPTFMAPRNIPLFLTSLSFLFITLCMCMKKRTSLCSIWMDTLCLPH